MIAIFSQSFKIDFLMLIWREQNYTSPSLQEDRKLCSSTITRISKEIFQSSMEWLRHCSYYKVNYLSATRNI